MKHYCEVCKTWCEEDQMHNENYCANCHLDRFLGEVEVDGIPTYVFANKGNLQFVMDISFYNPPCNLKEKLFKTLEDFSREDDTVICSGCDKHVSFKDAIVVTLNGQMLTICDYDCYLKLKEAVQSC